MDGRSRAPIRSRRRWAGPAEEIYSRPVHPYTQSLLAAVPRPDPDRRPASRASLKGDPPSPMAKPSACPFRTRCPIARPACAEAVPPLEQRHGRAVACPYSEPASGSTERGPVSDIP